MQNTAAHFLSGQYNPFPGELSPDKTKQTPLRLKNHETSVILLYHSRVLSTYGRRSAPFRPCVGKANIFAYATLHSERGDVLYAFETLALLTRCLQLRSFGVFDVAWKIFGNKNDRRACKLVRSFFALICRKITDRCQTALSLVGATAPPKMQRRGCFFTHKVSFIRTRSCSHVALPARR